MSGGGTNATISPEAVAQRHAAHERESLVRRRWNIAVTTASLGLLALYVWLLVFVRVMDPFYLIINGFSILTSLCGILVFRVYQLPMILAELPRLSEQDRRINLAAIEPIRAELLGRVLPSVGLARRSEEAAAVDDDELVRRLAGLQRPDWRKIARACLIAWLVVVPATLVGVALYRPDYQVSLLELFTTR